MFNKLDSSTDVEELRVIAKYYKSRYEESEAVYQSLSRENQENLRRISTARNLLKAAKAIL